MSIAEKLQTIAENEQKVYEAGKQAEYDAFWDSIQQNGERTDYYSGFSGCSWNDETFNPKYDICPEGATSMLFMRNKITDIKAILERNNIVLDLSKATGFSQFLSNSTITNIGIIDTRNATQLGHLLSSASSLETIEKLILKDDGSQIFNTNSFERISSLKNIEIEGKIGTSVNFVYPSAFGAHNLTHDSLISIINALADYSTDTSGTTYTCTLGSTNLAKLSDTEKAIATEKGWTLA